MDELNKCFIMICTKKTERECTARELFGARDDQLDAMKSIRPDDIGILFNVGTDELIGPFIATSEAARDIVAEAWGREFRAQVRVRKIGRGSRIKDGMLILANAGVKLDQLPSGVLVPASPVQTGSAAKAILANFSEALRIE